MSAFIVVHSLGEKQISQASGSRYITTYTGQFEQEADVKYRLIDRSLLLLQHLERRETIWPKTCSFALRKLRNQGTTPYRGRSRRSSQEYQQRSRDEPISIPGKGHAVQSFGGSTNINVPQAIPSNFTVPASDTLSRRTNQQFIGVLQTGIHNVEHRETSMQDINTSAMAGTEYDFFHNMIFSTDQPHFSDSQWDMFAASGSTHAMPDVLAGQFTDPLWAADMPFWNFGDTLNSSI